jgi:hypothetical protein
MTTAAGALSELGGRHGGLNRCDQRSDQRPHQHGGNSEREMHTQDVARSLE